MREGALGWGYSPSHITAFFQIYSDGSTGAGLNTTDGAVSEVILFDLPHGVAVEADRIFINEDLSEAEVSRRVLAAFRANELSSDALRRKVCEIRHRIRCPIGYGLGMSGAGAFSLALALNQALHSPFSYGQCLEFARRAEIESGTGLGDVVGQQFRGVMRGLPPYPSTAVAEIAGAPNYVVCAFFEPIETASIIRDPRWKAEINAIGGECMTEIHREPTYAKFIELARHFTFQTKLGSPRVMEVLQAVPQASMAMLGQTVFLLTSDIREGVEVLGRFTDRLYVSSVSAFGASALDYSHGG